MIALFHLVYKFATRLLRARQPCWEFVTLLCVQWSSKYGQLSFSQYTSYLVLEICNINSIITNHNLTKHVTFQVYLMEKAGRRPLLLYGMIGMAVSSAIITIGLNVQVRIISNWQKLWEETFLICKALVRASVRNKGIIFQGLKRKLK